MDFDYSKGGVVFNKFYPGLRPIHEAVRKDVPPFYTAFYVYEPGNATRYEALFNTYDDGFGRKTVLTLVNFRRSMIITNEMSITSLDYMQEKLGLGEGDCYALIPLINHYLEELGQ